MAGRAQEPVQPNLRSSTIQPELSFLLDLRLGLSCLEVPATPEPPDSASVFDEYMLEGIFTVRSGWGGRYSWWGEEEEHGEETSA